MMPSTPPMKTMNSLPLSPNRAGKSSAIATAARIESIENAMSAKVTAATVPQNVRSQPRGPGVRTRFAVRAKCLIAR